MTYGQVSTGYKGGGVNPRPFFLNQIQPFNPETLTTYEVGFKSDLFDRTMRPMWTRSPPCPRRPGRPVAVLFGRRPSDREAASAVATGPANAGSR